MSAAGILIALAMVARRCGPAGRAPDQAFLAGRASPWWAVAGSLVAAEFSALTLLGVPAAVCGGNWGYAQFFVGSLFGRLIVAALFLPALCDGPDLTCYGWIARRFGRGSGRASAALFCAVKVLSAGLRLLAAAAAASVLTGLGPGWCALALCAAAAAYIGYGGLRAVIWTGLWQTAFLLGAAAVIAVYALSQTPGHVHGALRLAEEGARLRFWHDAPGLAEAGAWRRWLTDPNIFWVAALNGLAGTLAALGCDHDFTQRLMSCRDTRDARRALALATVGTFAALASLLILGTCLYAYYRSHPALAVPEPLDRLYAHFAATVLPAPLRGVALAAVLLAAVDLPLSSLSAATVCDLWPRAVRALSTRARLAVASLWSAAILAAALWLLGRQDAMWVGAKATAVAAGPLLGIFLLGMTTKARGDAPALGALVLAAALNARLLWLSQAGTLPLDWGWLTVIGAAAAFSLGYGFSRLSAP